jgi:hypothetical protein
MAVDLVETGLPKDLICKESMSSLHKVSKEFIEAILLEWVKTFLYFLFLLNSIIILKEFYLAVSKKVKMPNLLD